MEADYFLYVLSCPTCGEKETNPRVGMSSDFQLTMVWECKNCAATLMALFPLEKLMRDAPSKQPEAPIAVDGERPDNRKEDRKFLKRLGICFDK